MTEPDITRVPWTPEQVESLNEYQRSGVGHPFTCGGCRDHRGTAFYYDEDGNIRPVPDDMSVGERTVLLDNGRYFLRERELVATLSGWICPTCGYRQDWAHTFMVNGAWRGQKRLLTKLFRP
jgi:hypothetical protein